MAIAIPDDTPVGVTSSVVIDDIMRVDWAEVTLTTSHSRAEQLRIVLTSPLGTESILAEPRTLRGAALDTLLGADRNYVDWTFTSARNWGEMSSGVWMLTVIDGEKEVTGEIVEWELTLHGVANSAFVDANQDHVRQDWEVGVADVTVTLWEDDGGDGVFAQSAVRITDSEGYFLMPDIDPQNNYFLEFEGVDGYRYTSDVAAPFGDGYLTPFLAPGSIPSLTANAGLLTDITGVVFQDIDGDSIWDEATEPTANAGMEVRLYRYDGQGARDPGGGDVLVGETTIDGSGRYVFFAEGQTPQMDASATTPQLPLLDQYYVEFEAPFGYVYVSPNQNPGMVDSDVDFANQANRPLGYTGIVVLGTQNGLANQLDAGIRQPGGFAGSVWRAISNVFRDSSSDRSLLPAEDINANADVGSALGVATNDGNALALRNLLKNSPGPDLGDLLGIDIPIQQHLEAEFAMGDEPTEGTVAEAIRAHLDAMLGASARGQLPGGESVAVTAEFDEATEEMRFAVAINASRSIQHQFSFDLLDSLSVNGSFPLTVEATFELDFILGFSLKTFIANPTDPSSLTEDHVFFEVKDFRVIAEIATKDIDAEINLGFLAAGIEDGSLSLQAGADISLDDLAGGDGILTLTEILAGNFDLSVAAFGSMHADLPITASIGGSNLTFGSTPRIILDDPNLFTNPPPTLSVQNFSNLIDFSNLTPGQVVGMLNRLGDWLDTYRDSKFFDHEIPLTDGQRVGDWFDSGTAFIDSIYKRLVSREILATGSQSDLFEFYGRLVEDAQFDLTIDSAEPVTVILDSDRTAENFSVADAAEDFNLDLAAVNLDSQVEFIIADDGRLSLVLLDGQTADVLKLEAASANDPIVTEVGFASTQESQVTQRFDTIQEFAALLGSILGANVTPGYDPATKEVTMTIHFDWGVTRNAPIDLGGSLGPIASFDTEAEFEIGANLTFDLTLGFDLNARSAPILTTSGFVPPPNDGRLSEDSEFYLVLGTDAPVRVFLPADNTNNSLDDLVDDLNAALIVVGLGDKVRATVTSANHIALSVINEDLDGDGRLDVDEDDDGDDILDRPEDSDGDGKLDTVFEDLNGDGELQQWEDANGDGDLDVNEDIDGDGMLGTVNEDRDGDGHLDVDEDTLIPNGILDSLLGEVLTLRILADEDDPIFTEVGFVPTTARSESHGLFVENATIAGDLTIEVTDIDADARFTIFGIEIGEGAATGSVGFNVGLKNPDVTDLARPTRVTLTELFTALNSGNLSQVVGNPGFHGSLDITLGRIALRPEFFEVPEEAVVRIGIPDITRIRGPDGEFAIHADPELEEIPTNPTDPGIWVVYPDLDGLFQFSKFDIPSYILALDDLVKDLEELSAFSFLGEPLPLLEQSLSEMIGQVAKLAEWINDVRSDPAGTLDALSAQLAEAIGIGPDVIAFSVDHTPNPTLTDTAPSEVFDPQGDHNGLLFTWTNPSAMDSPLRVRIVDRGTISNAAANAMWDSGRNILTVEINSGVTTANAVVQAVMTEIGNTNAPLTIMLDPADANNDGTGAITKTALKLSLNVTLAYGEIDRPFELNLADIADRISNPTAAALLGGFTSFIDVEGSGILSISAEAVLRIDFGLDLTNPCNKLRAFLYDSTGIELRARATATDLDFEAALGPLGVFVEDGTAALDGDGDPDTADDVAFTLDLIDNNGDGRHYFSESFFNKENLRLTFTGGVGVTLPIYFPARGLPYGGSSGDDNMDGFPDHYLVFEVPDLVRLFDPYETEQVGNSHQVTIQPVGGNNDFVITAPQSNIDVAFVPDPTATPHFDFDGSTLSIILNHGITTLDDLLMAKPPAGFTIALDTSEIEDNAVNDGSGAVKIPVLLITPDFGSLLPDINICSLLEHSGVLLDGLDALLERIEQGLDEVAFDGDFPLVGDGLSKGANFIRNFREGLLADIRDKLASVGGNPLDLVKQAIWNVLGGPGLNILVDPANPAILLTSFSQIDIDCINGANGEELDFNLRLKSTVAVVDTTDDPLEIDIGFPSLGLEIDGNVQIELGFDLLLHFAINKTDGFYFHTANANGDPELVVDLKITTPDLSVTGNLFSLEANIRDGHARTNPNGAPMNPSIFDGRFSVDILDPVGTGTSSPSPTCAAAASVLERRSRPPSTSMPRSTSTSGSPSAAVRPSRRSMRNSISIGRWTSFP